MAAQYSVEFNIAVEILANPGNPAAYDAERITDPAPGDLQSRMVSVRATREFDNTYASKMGGRVRVFPTDGTVIQWIAYGKKGSIPPRARHDRPSQTHNQHQRRGSTPEAATTRDAPVRIVVPAGQYCPIRGTLGGWQMFGSVTVCRCPRPANPSFERTDRAERALT